MSGGKNIKLQQLVYYSKFTIIWVNSHQKCNYTSIEFKQNNNKSIINCFIMNHYYLKIVKINNNNKQTNWFYNTKY